MSKTNLFYPVLLTCLCASLTAQAESQAVPQLSISNVVIGEGDSGNTPFTAQVSLYGWGGTITAKISATPGTADESDYVFVATQVTLAGSGTSQTVSGFIIGDTNPEGDEYFTLTATSVTPGAYPSIYSSGGKVTITDDDQARASQLHVEGVTLLEGDAGTTSAEVRIVLEPASTNTVSVAYQTADGTAVAGQDYVAASGTLTFAPGEVLKTVLIAIVGDTLPESDESFSVVLSQPKMALLGAARADVVIANDDTPVHATIADLEVDEGNDGVKSVPITITFDRPVPGSGKVQVRLVGVTAVADQDFRNFSQTLYPPAGATQMTFTVEILSDTQSECDEGLLIQYTEVYLGDDTTKTAKMVLRNDDEPALGCGDPFTPSPVAEPGLDGGARLPGAVDAYMGNHEVDAYAVSTTATDTQADSGIGPVSDTPDSGTMVPIDQRIGGSSGCACSLTGPSRETSLLVFAVAGIFAALVRRSRQR